MRLGLRKFMAKMRGSCVARVNLKQAVFDSLWWSYSALLLLYFFFNKEGAQEHMGAIALCTGVLVVKMFLLSATLQKIGQATLGTYVFGKSRKPLHRSIAGWHLFGTLLATVFVSAAMTETSLAALLDREGLTGASRMFKQLGNPNFELLPKAIVEIVETIFIAFLGTALALPVAFILSFFCAKNIMRGRKTTVVYLTLRTVLNVTRSMEPLVWAIIFTIWVGVGPFAGMLALFIHSVASLAKQFSEIVEGVGEGPIEAIRSTGADRIQTVWFGVVPQVVLPFISFSIYRWDINVRMATIIGLAGGGGIGTLLINFQGRGMWHEVGCIVLVIAVVVWFMDAASAHIREALK